MKLGTVIAALLFVKEALSCQRVGRGLIRRGSLLLLFLLGCAPELDKEHVNQAGGFVPVVILSSDYGLDVSKGLLLMVAAKDPGVSYKEIEKNIFLLKTPSKEILPFDEKVGHPLAVKRTKHQGQFSLQSTENLSIGAHYGVYYRESSSEKLSLLYAFLAQARPPRLRTEPGDKSLRNIHHQRILFKFVFDQPIHLHDDQAISLISLEENLEPPVIENLVVERDKTTISLRLKKDGKLFRIGKKYAFKFNSGLRNSDGQKTNEPPWEFLVVDDPLLIKLSGSKPWVVSTSSKSAEFKWLSKDVHDIQIFVEDEAGLFVSSLDSSAISFEKNLGRWLFNGLKSSTTYRFIARSESFTGELLHARGVMKTAPEEALRISEIMVNPLSPGGDRGGEYIEVVNVSDHRIALYGLHLRVEDKETSKITDCAIELSSSLFIDEGGYFLIVGGGFSGDNYGLDKNLPIIRLAQKTLCGGLSNEREKIIKLHRGDGHYIDRFGGHLWGSVAGQSVQRINPKGLDEANNYCYSNSSLGPTPGKINGPCEFERFKGGRT